MGCHIVLVDGAPLLDATAVRTLLDRRGNSSGPHFREGITGFGALALLGRLNESEIEAEATAQIRKLQTAGITVTHLDSHKHTHMFPCVLRPLLRAASSCGVKAIRNPFERLQGSQLSASPSLWRRWAEVGILRGLAKEFREAVRQAEISTPDGTLAIVATGSLNERLLRLMVENLPEGHGNWFVIPATTTRICAGIQTRLRESREQELRILTSSFARDLLAANGIEMISFRELAAAK